MPKRAMLFCHYDPQNVVDDHVLYTLKALAAIDIDIFVLSTSQIGETCLRLLEPLAREIHQLPNTGMDWGAYKTFLLERGIEPFRDYDELIFMNDSCYGPIFPLDELFGTIDSSECDFYGLTESVNLPPHYDHLQSYFLGLKKQVFLDPAFMDFFLKLQISNNYAEIVRDGEIAFSKMLYDRGYKSWTLVGPENEIWEEALDFKPQLAYNGIPWLLRSKRLPFVKIKSFATGIQGVNDRFNKGPDILAAIRKYSEYPADLINRHIRRVKPLSWHRNLDDVIIGLEDVPTPRNGIKIGVFAHLYYEDELYRLQKLSSIPGRFDLLVTTNNPEIRDNIEKVCQHYNLDIDKLDVRLIENRGRDLFGWLDTFACNQTDYEYALKYKDKKTTFASPETGLSWKEFIEESLLASKSHVERILGEMENNGKIGLVMPAYPPPLIFQNIPFAGGEENTAQMLKIMDRCGLPFSPDPFVPVFPVGNEFWYRPKALRQLFEMKKDDDDFPAEPVTQDGTFMHGMERVIPCVAHANGYEYRHSFTPDLLARVFRKYEDRLLRGSIPKNPAEKSDPAVEEIPLPPPTQGDAIPYEDSNGSDVEQLPLRHQIYIRFEGKFPRLAGVSRPLARAMWKLYKKL